MRLSVNFQGDSAIAHISPSQYYQLPIIARFLPQTSRNRVSQRNRVSNPRLKETGFLG
ncbi:hypothetical protein SPLC1_S531200 [Arthrospira platensis C1]|nr:hypothetical protein SPLC1_S531200 [Arthrospira platensis C1]